MNNLVSSGIKEFIFGGNASFTIKQEPNIQAKYYLHENDDRTLWFLSTDDVNSGKMIYTGCIREDGSFKATKKSPSVINMRNVKALQWVIKHAEKLPKEVGVYHHGKCSVCGRKLTDARSLECGIGPSCRKKLGLRG